MVEHRRVPVIKYNQSEDTSDDANSQSVVRINDLNNAQGNALTQRYPAAGSNNLRTGSDLNSATKRVRTSQSGAMTEESDHLTGFTVSPRLIDNEEQSSANESSSHCKSPRFGETNKDEPGKQYFKTTSQKKNTLKRNNQQRYQDPSEYTMTQDDNHGGHIVTTQPF